MISKVILRTMIIYGFTLVLLVLIFSPGILDKACSFASSKIDSASLAWLNFRGIENQEDKTDANTES